MSTSQVLYNNYLLGANSILPMPWAHLLPVVWSVVINSFFLKGFMVLLSWLSGKESAFPWRRGRFDPWVRKIPWRRKWWPTTVLLPENSMDRGAWWATVHGVAKRQTHLSMHARMVNSWEVKILPFRILSEWNAWVRCFCNWAYEWSGQLLAELCAWRARVIHL